MGTETERTNERLLAQVELAEDRLDRFHVTAHEVSAEERQVIQDRCNQIAQRCEEMRDEIRDWREVRIGAQGAVEDLGSAVDTLEDDVTAMKEQHADAYRSAVDRQLRSWRSRAEYLRVQGALAAMELRDDLDVVGDRLTDARAGVLLELHHAADDAKDIVIDVRKDVEAVLVDVRHAVERAADALVGDRS